MTLTRRLVLAGAGLLATPALLRSQAQAQAQANYPNRPVRMVVPFPGGGATDVTARVISERLSQMLGQPVVVDNRPGAGGILGCDMVAKAEPDGHTLLMCTIGTASINQYLYSKMPYDPKELAPVALVNSLANVITVPTNSPIRDFRQLLQMAKGQELMYGTPGNGTSGHMCGELLKFRTETKLTHIPYRGSATVIPDLLAGRIDLAVDNLPPYLPHIQEGRLRALAVTSRNRWFALPEVPTVAEMGVADFEAEAWFGVQAHARTPKAITDRVSKLVLDITGEPAATARLRDVGSEPRPLDAAAFGAFIERENTKWREVVRVSGARLD
ncbi:tripartite tricarboxylate transporter substrate binding protein [Pseudoroseomonas cervicalis]|uniref:Bug family tripartite tricarboxylate transporter substrate binding protein n=1 Tax=Teichococcus cervicalis TaxID=204525 RepID=UPI00278144E3|nr:tripartite tricarboxylate transporter substrate binding protein [Pseudoroseomonas cervicalis]MDQ1080289.1 tripartite-type tricarboxylate transporter receptor subunit TctC [Pseudoroseomonas cervicalis]